MIEGKYTVDFGNQHLVLSILQSLCYQDSEHPSDYINSIYYDTIDLALLDQKVSSDFRKEKVRLRWYGSPSELIKNIPAYLEVKQKYGVQRSKSRKLLSLNGDLLQFGQESFIEVASYVDYVTELGFKPRGILYPMIVIRYLRYRFEEPVSGSRISLDTGIMYSNVNNLFFPWVEPRSIKNGVLEIKSKTGEIPQGLMSLKSRVNTRDSFSKYGECWGLYSSTSYRRALTSSRYD